MAAIGITGMGLTGVVRMNWVQDDLAHVLEHSHTDETSGTWTNPRELHQTGAFAQVAWWAGFRNGRGRLAAGAA